MFWHAVIFGPEDTPWEGGANPGRAGSCAPPPNRTRTHAPHTLHSSSLAALRPAPARPPSACTCSPHRVAAWPRPHLSFVRCVCGRHIQVDATVQRGLPEQGARRTLRVQNVPPEQCASPCAPANLQRGEVRDGDNRRPGRARSIRGRRHLSRHPAEPVEPHLRRERHPHLHSGTLARWRRRVSVSQQIQSAGAHTTNSYGRDAARSLCCATRTPTRPPTAKRHACTRSRGARAPVSLAEGSLF